MSDKRVKSKKKREYSHFCFCIRLRPGVIISSALWVMEGIVLSALLILYAPIKINKDSDKQPSAGEAKDIISFMIDIIDQSSLSMILIPYFIILSLLSALGLVSLIVNKSTWFMRMYSYISWFYTVFINSVVVIVSIIAMIVNSSYYIANEQQIVSSKEVIFYLLWLSIIALFQISLHFYFSIILRAYVKHRIQKVNVNYTPNYPNYNLSIASSKRSSAPSKSPNVPGFNIKVDKTFDVRNQIV